MLDLSVDFAGLELKNPLVVASSECVRDIRQIKKAEQCGASAVIVKAIFPPGVIGLQRNMRIFVEKRNGAFAEKAMLSQKESMIGMDNQKSIFP